MPIETDFKFSDNEPGNPATATNAVALELDALVPAPSLLGPLQALLVTGAKQAWQGTGFNMIWRPAQATGHFLQLNMTGETLTFNDITGKGIPNRGLLQGDIFLGGLAYVQEIIDTFDNSGQHFEPGVFLSVGPTTNPAEPQTVARMGSIPHGTTINLQGVASVSIQPAIGAASITPFTIGSPDNGNSGLVRFPEEQLGFAGPTRTPLNQVAGLDQAHLANPNLFLSDALAGQTITRTTTINLTSDSSSAGAVPDVGGGVANIAFLEGKAGGPNADVPRVTATFFIEEGTDASGQPFRQLQYTQRVLLDFAGLSWPHITVGTLRPI